MQPGFLGMGKERRKESEFKEISCRELTVTVTERPEVNGRAGPQGTGVERRRVSGLGTQLAAAAPPHLAERPPRGAVGLRPDRAAVSPQRISCSSIRACVTSPTGRSGCGS